MEKRTRAFCVCWAVFPPCFPFSCLTVDDDYHVRAGQAFQHHSNGWTLLTMWIFFSPPSNCPWLSRRSAHNASFESRRAWVNNIGKAFSTVLDDAQLAFMSQRPACIATHHVHGALRHETVHRCKSMSAARIIVICSKVAHFWKNVYFAILEKFIYTQVVSLNSTVGFNFVQSV